MALTYKTDVVTLNAANTDFTILTAAASTTLVKNISWIHDDHNTTVILSLTKSGGSKIAIGEFAATANAPLKIWTDILPLAAGDVLHLQSNHIASNDVGYLVISYVEDTASVAGQSVAVHTDVNISGITNGQILAWNNTEFQPTTASGGASDTDELAEGTTNLYFTDARVSANSAVTANTAKVGFTDAAVAANSAVTANTAKIALLSDDNAPQLGGNLDVNTNEIQSDGDLQFRIDADNNTALSKFVIKDGTGASIYTIDEEGTTIATTGASNNIKIGNLDSTLGTFNGISLNNNLTYPGIVGFAGGSNTNDNFFLFGTVVDIRAGGASDSSMRIAETNGETQVVINHSFPVPTTHTLFVDGNGKFTENVDFAQGITVTGNVVVSGTIDGIDVGTDVAANTAKVGYTNAAVDARIVNARTPYDYQNFETDRNIVMESDVSQSTNKICDVLGDDLASKANATAKKLIGWHTGSGECVLRGFIDLNASITATAGEPLYLSTAGNLSASPPTGNDEYSRIVGYFIGVGQGGEIMVYFNPSPDWIQITV